MDRICFAGQELAFKTGETVAEVALRHGIRIEQPCGGAGTCRKCVVRDQKTGESFLACQTSARDGMNLTRVYTEASGAKILEFNDFKPQKAEPEIVSSILPQKFAAPEKGGVYGVALDIGTTTLAASLVDLDSGKLCGTASCTNGQTIFGGDVISRISYATDVENGLEKLQAEVVGSTNGLLKKLADKAGLDPKRIFHIIAAGNTTMEHCFLGVSPESIGRVPFEPAFYRAERRVAGDLALRVNERAYVDLIPNIAGFIGGDLLSGIYHTRMHEREELTLLIDIGTNNEMVLGNRDFLLACSTAAGPALEGARIRDGMRAGHGAIEHAHFLDGEIACSVIEDASPVGICGSGLVDLVCGLLEVGIISPSGRMIAPGKNTGNPYAERIVATSDGKEFWIAPKGAAGNGFVAITQKDIRELQLAKGAIKTGVEMLLENAGKHLEDVGSVLLAGAFGSYMDMENAIKLGILPNVPRGKIRLVGNSAGLGCLEALLDKGAFDLMNETAKRIEHIELATSAAFQEKFVQNLAFGEC